MSWLSRTKRLPTTSYGYTPPPGATASGWQCNNAGCGTGESPAPRTWPARCRSCGRFVDPDFDQPWREEARGYRLQMLIDREGDDGGIFGGQLREWKYGRTLAAGDLAAAEVIRVDTDRWLTAPNRRSTYPDGVIRSMLVIHALNHGQIDAAARELTTWFDIVDVHNLDVGELGAGSDEGNRLRVTCFSLFRSALDFLDRPTAKTHPAAAAIDPAARYLGSATQHEMPADLRYRWQKLMRTRAVA